MRKNSACGDEARNDDSSVEMMKRTMTRKSAGGETKAKDGDLEEAGG